MNVSPLIEASRRWAASRPAMEPDGHVVIICCPHDYEGGFSGVPPECMLLVDAIKLLGKDVCFVDWTDDRIDWTLRRQVVLPLLAWNYCESIERFTVFLHKLRKAEAEPQADLRAVEWILHKG